MTYKSHEKSFYVKHYSKSPLDLMDKHDMDSVQRDFFSNGKRYNLIESIIDGVIEKDVLLELGCGHGATLKYMAEKYKFRKSIGVDIVYENELFIDQNNRIKFQPGNLNEELQLEKSGVNLLVAMMVIEHLFDPFHAFTEVHRLLASNGIAVINLPIVTNFKNRIRFLFGRLPVTSVSYDRWYQDRQWDGNHLHYFSIESIRDLCSACNLEIIETRAVGSHVRIKNLFPKILTSELTFAVKKAH